MLGSRVDPKKGDLLLSTLLTAPSRGRASMARPCQDWGSKTSSRDCQVRVTLLGQKGSPGKSGIRTAQRNHRAMEDPTAIWWLFCSVGGELERIGHFAD